MFVVVVVVVDVVVVTIIVVVDNVVTVDVEVVADVLRQRRLPHRPGLVRAGGKVLTDLKDPVVEFYNLLSRVFLKMDPTLLEI